MSGEKTKQKTHGAILYVRVSSEEQVKNTSIGGQLDACRAKAEELGLPIIAEYKDEGVSGTFLKARPGIQAALREIEAGRGNRLICLDISRLSRDVEHQQIIKKTVEGAGARLLFCDMNFDDTPEGDFAYNTFGNFRQFERHVIRTRTMGGKFKQARQGIQAARSLSPYGYHIVTKKDILRGLYLAHQLGQYIVIEHEAKVVRRLYECYAAGSHSMPQLTKELNAEGVPTPKGGTHWRASTLHDMLTNSTYKGQPVFGKTQSRTDEKRFDQKHHFTGQPLITARYNRPAPEENWVYLTAPALVDEATWDTVQEKLGQNKARKGGNPHRARMLSGRVFCPECGAGLQVGGQIGGSGGKKSKYVYYVCGRNRNKRADTSVRECVATGYNIETTERDTAGVLLHTFEHPEAVEATVQAHVQARPADVFGDEAHKELASIDKALNVLKSDEAATVQAQIMGLKAGASIDAYNAVFAEIADKRKDLQDRRRVLSKLVNRNVEANAPQADPAAIHLQTLKNVALALSSPDITGAEKRDLLSLIVDKVIPSKEGVTVQFGEGVWQDVTLQHMWMSTHNAALLKA